MLNKRGLKIEPFGTPISKSMKSLKESFTLVLCFLSVSQLCITFTYEKPYASRLAIRKPCTMQSKALLKSVSSVSHYLP